MQDNKSPKQNGTDPDKLVRTPGGYKSRAKVFEITPDHHIAERNRRLLLINTADDTMVQDLGPSAASPGTQQSFKPHLPGQQSLQPAAEAEPGPNDGWVAYAVWTNTAIPPINEFTAAWTVPEEPETKDQDQTIFLFIGMQNAEFILQPVLQWGESAAGGGRFWSVCNWYTDGKDSTTVHTKLIEGLKTGSQLKARISLVGQEGRSFKYVASFELQQPAPAQDQPPAQPQDLQLEKEDVIELLFANIALESYGVQDRKGYPASETTVFSGISIQVAQQPAHPAWQPIPHITAPSAPFVTIPADPGDTLILNFGAMAAQDDKMV